MIWHKQELGSEFLEVFDLYGLPDEEAGDLYVELLVCTGVYVVGLGL